MPSPRCFWCSRAAKKFYAYSDEEREAIIDRLIEERKAKKGAKAAAEVVEPVEVEATEEGEVPENTASAPDADSEEVLITDEERNRLKAAGVSPPQRYKGLGEMNAEQLWETTMDPEKRILLQVSIEDAEKADAIFNKLMGEEVLLRKNFIQTHATAVTDLDI